MIRYTLLTLFLLLSVAAFARPDSDMVRIICKLDDCITTPKLFQFDGIGFRLLQQAKEKEGKYIFNVEVKETNFYYVGTAADNLVAVILGPEKEITVTGNCNQLKKTAKITSTYNQDYLSLRKDITEQRNESNKLNKAYMRSMGNKDKMAKIEQRMKLDDDLRLALLDSLKEADPYMQGIVALNTYLSFPNNKGNYTNEAYYFINEFFKHADFNDPIYNRLPWMFETFQSYTATLNQIIGKADDHKRVIEEQLNKIPQGTRAHQLALAGVVTALSQKNHANLMYFADQFISTFKDSAPIATSELTERISAVRKFMIGGEAPDFTQKTPEGEDLSLSELKGKVVLIDFWASWCGPCRRENPHVKALYDQYKDQGFEILGVSLDNNRARWESAIKSDKLTWKHVSDLKGWKNAAAKQYGVKSIPHTVLLDANGKILARGLRSEQLAQKLKEIFADK